MAACGSDDASGGDTDNGGASGTITLGFIPSWTDGLSTAYLLEDQLTKLGYEVEMEELQEPGVLYAGLANGDFDMYPSAWPEVTHADYMKEFGDDIEDIGTYYENAKLTMAVPSYVDVSSIEDLKGHAGDFGGRVVGIEAGAGLTKATKEKVFPEYGLSEDGYELLTSSTPAMLAELKKATEAKQDIVVTLWRPFWANSAFDMKDLEDPKGALGKSEALHFLGATGFAEKFPEAAEMIKGIKLSDEDYGSMEKAVNDAPEGEREAAIDTWLDEHPDAFPTMVKE